MTTAPRSLPGPQLSERSWQAQVVAEARRFGWTVLFTHDSRHSPAGMPDLLLIHPARRLVWFRELKSENGKIRDEQRYVIDCLREAGADVGIWRPSDADTVWRLLAPPARRRTA